MVVLHEVFELIIINMQLDHLYIGRDVLDHEIDFIPRLLELSLEIAQLPNRLSLELRN